MWETLGSLAKSGYDLGSKAFSGLGGLGGVVKLGAGVDSLLTNRKMNKLNAKAMNKSMDLIDNQVAEENEKKSATSDAVNKYL